MISASRQKRANASWFPCSSGSSSLTAKLPGQAHVLRLVDLAHRAAPDAAAERCSCRPGRRPCSRAGNLIEAKGVHLASPRPTPLARPTPKRPTPGSTVTLDGQKVTPLEVSGRSRCRDRAEGRMLNSVGENRCRHRCWRQSPWRRAVSVAPAPPQVRRGQPDRRARGGDRPAPSLAPGRNGHAQDRGAQRGARAVVGVLGGGARAAAVGRAHRRRDRAPARRGAGRRRW